MTTALDDLIAAVKAGDDVAFRRANRAMFSTPCQELGLQLREENARHAYKGSLDAALDLHNAVLPGWEYGVTDNAEQPDGPCAFVCEWGDTGEGFQANSTTPARAWLLAILKALESRDSAITPARVAEVKE